MKIVLKPCHIQKSLDLSLSAYVDVLMSKRPLILGSGAALCVMVKVRIFCWVAHSFYCSENIEWIGFGRKESVFLLSRVPLAIRALLSTSLMITASGTQSLMNLQGLFAYEDCEF